MIALPLFSQRDDRWKSKKLGTGLLTLGTSGCLDTCLAMVSKYYGKETDPSKFDDDLIRVNGFAPEDQSYPDKNKDLYIWGSVNKIYPDISEPKRVQTPNPVTSTQFASIDVELNAGRPVIIEVDFVPATASIDMHFVVLIGKDVNGNYVIADPWWGDTATLQRYGDPAKTIQQFIFTFGAIPTQPVTQPTDDQSNALAVVRDGFQALPTDDPLRQGNLEGFVRELVEEHKNYTSLSSDSKQLQGFIQKWLQEWGLPADGTLVTVEDEMEKHLAFEDRATVYRNAIEGVVGFFTDDNTLLTALKAEKDDKQGLADKVNKLQGQVDDLKKKQNIKYSFNVLGYVINILEKG